VTLSLRRWFCLALAWAAAALICLLAVPGRADVDGGAPPSDAGGAPSDAGVAEIDGAVFETLAPPPPPSPPPDLTLPATSATLSTTMVEAAPPPAAEEEPPRPITRRLWFWLAISGAVVAASLVVMAVRNPSVERPDCPEGYVCPR
jgi:hypothetical protein